MNCETVNERMERQACLSFAEREQENHGDRFLIPKAINRECITFYRHNRNVIVMPRIGRVQSGTGIYHVMLRGINR